MFDFIDDFWVFDGCVKLGYDFVDKLFSVESVFAAADVLFLFEFFVQFYFIEIIFEEDDLYLIAFHLFYEF